MASYAAIPHTGRDIREFPIADGEAFPEGAAVVLVSGEIEECGADPALIAGFALHEAGADPNPTRVLVSIAKAGATFWLPGSSAPVAADIGTAYGLAVDGDGDWVVDKTDTTATRVRVVDIDTTRELFEVSVLAANRQFG